MGDNPIFGVIFRMTYSSGKFTANQNQSLAIRHPSAPLMILAGAGTGKTTTLFHRILYMIEMQKIDPKTILAITYTEKAAKELRTRVKKQLNTETSSITVGTLHAFCYSIVKTYNQNKKDAPTLLEEGDAIFLLLNHFDSFRPFESVEFALDPVKAVTQSFIPFFNRLRDELINLDHVKNPDIDGKLITEETVAQLNDLRRIYPLFQALKKKRNYVDYGDMILQAYLMMDEDSSLRETLQDTYRHIIVDEFQDNNHALNEVIGMIACKHGSITVVGDDDQVIYSFRGASAYNIRDFQKRYQHFPDYKEISLVENYRSHQQILNVANDVILTNKDRIAKTLTAYKQKNGFFPELWWGTKKDQLSFMATKIRTLVSSGEYDYQDIAILCRTRAQVKEAVKALQKVHVPVFAYLTEYFQIPAIRDVMAWCSLLANGQHQNSALYRILNHYLRDEETLRIFQAFSKRDSTPRLELIGDMWDTLPDIIRHKLEFPMELIRFLQADIRKKHADEMVWEICERTNLFRPLFDRYEYQDQIAIQNVGDFIKRAQSFTKNHPDTPSLPSFIHYMSTLQRSGSIAPIYPKIPTRPAILVQTIHGVKGGEFPAVFVPFNQTGSFPLNYRPSRIVDRPPDDWLAYSRATSLTPKEHHYQEERRIFYVALTRAKDKLFILAPDKRTSPFIKKDLTLSLTEENTMPKTESSAEPSSVSQLRHRYETRLNDAIALNQYDQAHTLIKCVERLASIEKDDTIVWTDHPWEIELKNELHDNFEPSSADPLSLSASSIETYASCPLKYRLSNIDHVPEKPSKPQLTFGNIIHQVLEKFHDGDTVQTEAHLLALLDEYWTSEGFDYQSREEKFFEQGQELLKRYWTFIKDNPPDIIATEREFQFDIKDVTIRGKIDRIDHGSAGLRVIDYKTSKTASPAKKSLQLAIYSLYLQQSEDTALHGLPEWAGLFFLREKDDPLKTHQFTIEELLETRNNISEVASNIRKKRFPAKKGFHCEWCDYKHLLCPEWEGD